jgi:glycosyltransferase involved in cell wall biosynthesis
VTARALSILHTEASLGWGGQEIRILNESLGMQARGHTITLAAPAEARISSEARTRGLKVIETPIGRKNLRGLMAMRTLLRGGGFDIVNTHSSTDSWLAALALAFGAQGPALVRTRHISAPVSTGLATRWLYRHASVRIATTGETLRRELIDTLGLDPARVLSVPTGMDTDRFKPGDRAAARDVLELPRAMTLVGIVATLRSWKGHRHLIEAVARLVKDAAVPIGSDPIGLVIVGDGPQREALAAQAATLGLPAFWMPGNQTDVVPWLHALDIFALPSYANEGVPQALVQAMLCGLACITTTVGAIGEAALADRTALVVTPQSVDEIAAAIERLARDPELRARLGMAARDHCIAHFDARVMLDRMEGLFQAAAGAR